jgi:hypothetical protein
VQRGRTAVLWLGLAAALSAPLADLATHVATWPWARGSALFVVLFAIATWTDPSPARPARDGWLWLGIGLVVSLVGVAGGMTRTGRPGIAIAAIGLARALGRPSLPRAAVAAWIVPVPSALQNAVAPGLAWLAAGVVARVGVLAGIPVLVDASKAGRLVFEAPRGALELFPGDGGLPLAWTLAGVGWFAVVQRGGTAGPALRRAVRFAIAALPLQLAALALACGSVLVGASALGRTLLDQLVLGAGLAALWLALRSGATAPAAPHPAASRA